MLEEVDIIKIENCNEHKRIRIDVAVNLIFCWLFVIFMAMYTFSGLPFHSEQVDNNLLYVIF